MPNYNRVNMGATSDINDIINEGAFSRGQSRSDVIRLAIKQRYSLNELEPVKGPYTLFLRVNIPKEGVAYVRELAYDNELTLASIYCAMIKKYLHGS